MSQALIYLYLGHEEFKMIVNEKEKYEQMKESIRNTNSRDELSEKTGVLEEIVEMHRFKKNIFFLFCVYKMVEITK